MEALSCNFSGMVVGNCKVINKMNGIPDTGFEEADKGNFNFVGIRAYSGVRNDKDDLLILNPEVSQQINDFRICIQILYQLAKLRGRNFVSWNEVLIDADQYQLERVVFLQRHFSPNTWDNHLYSWQGEIVICSPNDELIEYAIEYVKERRVAEEVNR